MMTDGPPRFAQVGVGGVAIVIELIDKRFS
ncbi:MAG: hypothetical protein ACJAYU_004722 [Bradymonadia bacterium]|jgi:hypothetical protein